MGYWLAPPGSAKAHGHIKRFDVRFWVANFSRPMMAAVTTTAPNMLRADAVFYKANDLAGLIWEAEDRHDHPLLAYETNRDFRGCILKFRWRSGGIKTLDAVHGPTLTIEGRDAAKNPRSWYVRLWNYAVGTPENAVITLNFDTIAGGFLLPGEADPVWAGDIDRMFLSMVAPDYTAIDAPLAAIQEGWAELSEMSCDGAGSVLSIGDAIVPEHQMRIATGYDDLYHLTPARILRNCLHLGYRGPINHYVGMSHYFRLEGLGGGYYASLAGSALNVACTAWHRDFATRAGVLGYELIISLSYELFDAHCWNDWKQRAENGDPALTAWSPPSALLSPAHSGAMNYLRAVARAFAAIVRDAGLPVRFQIGEPWWWVMQDGRICIYDDAAQAAFSPVPIADVHAPLDTAQKATLDAAGAVLAASTAALCAAVKEEAPGAETLLLVYLPSILASPDIKRANLPIGWATPAFDILQVEDYDWATTANSGATMRAIAELVDRLGYPVENQHYFAGFVLNPEDAGQWQAIAAAADAACKRGTNEIFIWALPQVLRDGFVWFEVGEKEVDAFDDVRFPIALGREASVEPAFSTSIVTTASGAEQRNSDWVDARLRFDAGPGVRGEAELIGLVEFFRARRGAAKGFRFEDPFDHAAEDQLLGHGNGVQTRFQLVKRYGEQVRRITRPVANTVRIFIGGIEWVSGWILDEKGVIQFDAAPIGGEEIRASYNFDVPVRFAEDRLHLSRATFEAGEVANVPLIEIREDAA